MERVTLDKLLKEVHVNPEKLNERISDDHLREIAFFLTEWKTVVPFLGLDENDVDVIEREENKEQVRKLKALRKWKGKVLFEATYRKLVEVLLSLAMADVAEKVCHLLKVQCVYANPSKSPPCALKVLKICLWNCLKRKSRTSSHHMHRFNLIGCLA